MILTSADFGDAYLRDGWASQYVEDRMRLNSLVLVGYAAEDTASVQVWLWVINPNSCSRRSRRRIRNGCCVLLNKLDFISGAKAGAPSSEIPRNY